MGNPQTEAGHSLDQDLLERIAGFFRSPDPAEFEGLALQAFAFQYRRIAPYRRLCESYGVEPGSISDWRQIPAVPVLAFNTLELHAATAAEVFRSSGTIGDERSVHHHPFPDLYRRVIDATFPGYCLDESLGDQPPMLALVASRQQIQDSSLGFMVDHVLRRHGGPGSGYAFGERGVEADDAGEWCAARQGDGRPGLILATSFALAQWLDTLTERGERFRLPAGSAIFDTGGFKGRTRELSREELSARLERRLGVADKRVVREYGMTELTSQFYTRALTGGDRELFVGPPWLKARVFDPETMAEAPAGTTGVLAVFDLANVGSAVHLLTQDLAVDEGGGFRLRGRASDAELRGCSLTVEQLGRVDRLGGPPGSVRRPGRPRTEERHADRHKRSRSDDHRRSRAPGWYPAPATRSCAR